MLSFILIANYMLWLGNQLKASKTKRSIIAFPVRLKLSLEYTKYIKIGSSLHLEKYCWQHPGDNRDLAISWEVE